jgi:hypothetical protein
MKVSLSYIQKYQQPYVPKPKEFNTQEEFAEWFIKNWKDIVISEIKYAEEAIVNKEEEIKDV